MAQRMLSKRLVQNDVVYPHWIGNSDCFWYEREILNGKEFRIVSAKTGTNESAFDHQKLAGELAYKSGESIDPVNLPISTVEIELSPTIICFTAFGKRWVFKPDLSTCEMIDSTATEGLHSPDGKNVAFTRNYNLWIRNLTSGEEYALTQDGKRDYQYATASAHYGVPSSSLVQAVWSPDSQSLLTCLLDTRLVCTTPFVHHVPRDGSVRPEVEEIKISNPGDSCVESYRILAIEIESNTIQEANYDLLPMARMGMGFFSDEKFGWWANDSRRAFFIDITRGAKQVRVVEIDTKTGETKCLIEERSATFVKLSHALFEPPIFLPIPDNDELIWFSERSGWPHLYLYDLKTGRLRHALTEGKWVVRNILHYDAKRREILLQTAGCDQSVNPYYRDICRLDIDTRVLKKIISGNYEHVVFQSRDYQVKAQKDGAGINGVSPTGNYIVTTISRVDTAPISVLIDREANNILQVETTDITRLPIEWQWPEPVKVRSADGDTDIHGVIFRPPGFKKSSLYPVIDFSCVNPSYSFLPHAAFTSSVFCGEAYHLGLAYAALGFIVIAIDVPGQPYRSKSFQDASYGSMNSMSSFVHRISAIKQIAEKYTNIDLQRVGIVGCEGATDPVYGMLQHPEFYKVGVSINYQDFRLALASTAELYEGISNQSEVTPYAEELVNSLSGKLLLIHGMLDYPVPVTATMRLIEALQKANKDFDLLLLPNDKHPASCYALRRTWDYLVEYLKKTDKQLMSDK